jgi:hypothetical protein
VCGDVRGRRRFAGAGGGFSTYLAFGDREHGAKEYGIHNSQVKQAHQIPSSIAIVQRAKQIEQCADHPTYRDRSFFSPSPITTPNAPVVPSPSSSSMLHSPSGHTMTSLRNPSRSTKPAASIQTAPISKPDTDPQIHTCTWDQARSDSARKRALLMSLPVMHSLVRVPVPVPMPVGCRMWYLHCGVPRGTHGFRSTQDHELGSGTGHVARSKDGGMGCLVR